MIKKLKLKSYRNIDELELEFDPFVNIIYGDNAQGKTNIVEALDYLSNLKSFRNVEQENLIKVNEKFATINAIDDKNDSYNVVITKERRNMSINKTTISKKADFIGNIITITFSPENVDMFKDSPKIRRDFLDDSLSLIFPSYSTYLLNFDKYRVERNNTLKEEKVDKVLIDTYDSLLSNYSKVIVNRRNEFIKSIKTNLNKYYQNLTNTKSNIDITYKSDFLDIDEKEIYELYKKNYEFDLERGQTLLGPHKDDIVLSLDNNDISVFGSQGQNRIAVISLKLATLDYIYEVINKKAIVILDDVLSELDEDKQNRLLNNLNSSYQLFITTTKDIKIEKAKKIRIENGCVKEKENG